MSPETLFSENHGLAYGVALSLGGLGWHDREDAIQVALAALWRAAQTYDPSRRYRFSTYATVCIRNAILGELKRLRRPRPGQLADSTEADVPFRDEPEPAPDPAEVRRLLGSVPERWRDVLTWRYGLDGKGSRTLDQVGAALGVTRQRVAQIQGQALACLRERLGVAVP